LGQAIRDRVFRLPPAALVGLAAVLIGVVSVGGVLLYRTYSYVQHDNDFCLSCHLMRNPYERFSRSAHRDLGCKACHQPTLVARSTMALTQIIEQPAELQTHAEVPNERCADCHIDGDPEKWQQVAQTAGHRIHLGSDDPRLEGLQCVQCHSSSVHEFAATDRTCGQAGCHENTRVRLGKMGQLTIHCAACHNFSVPLAANAPAESVSVSLRPQQQECLSCHAMRQRVGLLPANDPHGGACGTCHDPHQQTTPAEAVQSCGNAGCHEGQDTVSPMHRSLGPGVFQQCTRCHEAHSFQPRGSVCMDCHQDIYQRTVATAGSAALVRAGRDSLTFQHGQHQPVACTRCHDTQRTHGGVLGMTSFATCSSVITRRM
jgi:nitrate/TMAO reductase-like tetraheme cytochrome c subunit